jgi:formylglycine-generating enzyme required for sulfatase activity
VLSVVAVVPQAMATPSVTNIRSFQQAGTKLVQIDYDLSGSGGPFWVSVQGSADGGVTWTLPVASVSGKVGAGIAAAGNQRITWNAGADWNGQVSDLARFKVTASDVVPPGNFVLIPAGSFEMGDTFSEGSTAERPVHTVNVSAFWMQNTEVTNDQMADVLNWAYPRGKLVVTTATVKNAAGNQQEILDLDDADCRILWNPTLSRFEMKAAKGSGYPCVEVTWYGCAAWCNYRSEIDGLTPCYSFTDWSCNFAANGYRVPTEAEWEKAARGGVGGKRFPWGDTITHSQANYYSSSSYSYDISPTRGFHPTYATGGYPYTSPVGSFPATGYGLYDMTGNVWEWCHDWYSSSYYSSSPGSDPTGPSAGSDRVLRGGYWYGIAYSCRVASRSYPAPAPSDPISGFRPVRR